MSEQANDRRRFHRIAFDAPPQLVQGSAQWATELHDLSLRGLLAVRPADFSGDQSQEFTLRVELGAETVVEMEATLARDDGELLAFTCQHIDLDSISHLRRLVELNLADSDLLERELAALGESA